MGFNRGALQETEKIMKRLGGQNGRENAYVN